MSVIDTNDPKDLPEVIEYQVIVKRIRKNVKTRDHAYKNLGTKDENGEDEYGYVYFDKFVTTETEVYNQRVDKIDLPEVIKAVNGMEKE